MVFTSTVLHLFGLNYVSYCEKYNIYLSIYLTRLLLSGSRDLGVGLDRFTRIQR